MELLSFQQSIATAGWAVTDPVMDARTIAEWRDCVAPLAQTGRGGARNLLDEANWKVIWHQDLTVAAQQRIDIPGYGPWTHKAGVPHVQPPVDVLEQMLAIRVHLDPCGEENGPFAPCYCTHRVPPRVLAIAASFTSSTRRDHSPLRSSGIARLRKL
jgi:hypothetical protein